MFLLLYNSHVLSKKYNGCYFYSGLFIIKRCFNIKKGIKKNKRLAIL